MRALGLAIKVDQRPILHAVLLEDLSPPEEAFALTNVSVITKFQQPTTEQDWPTQFADLSAAVSGRLKTLRPDLVVIRRADFSSRGSNRAGPQIRLMATGAVTAAAKLLIPATYLRTGSECGTAYGATKADVDRAAKTLVPTSFVEAAAAALSALHGERG